MTLQTLIHTTVLGSLLTPLTIFIVLGIAALSRRKINEKLISNSTQAGFLLYLFCAATASIGWLLSGHLPYKWDFGTFYRTSDDSLTASLYLDDAASIFLLTTAIISNTIVFFSRRYLHRDPGYRRFFMILSLFVFGITLFTTAGTFDFIFVGWEIVGLSSFLLIGFYWHRRGAALNANRAYFIYRVTDVGLLASALISHLVLHSPDLFFDLSSGNLLSYWESTPLWQQWTLSILILLPVIGKSAQFPLCYWLPKAMEGPTPSSAIFYGSLSVHAGVFLLIRTYSIWFHTPGFVWLLGAIGLITAIFSTLCGRLQANIKGQVGYASIAQVGLMLIELALGVPELALIHLVGNAFLRCFQLLVSSSILTQQLQIHSALEGKNLRSSISLDNLLPTKLRQTIYIWALNEGYIEPLIRRYIVTPLMRLARASNILCHLFFSLKLKDIFRRPTEDTGSTFSSFWLAPIGVAPLAFIDRFVEDIAWLPYLLLLLALVFSLAALGEIKRPTIALYSATLSNAFAVGSLWLHHPGYRKAAVFYLIGMMVSWLLANDALQTILQKRRIQSLYDFSGLFSQFPIASALVLLGLLGIMGFPVSSTFFGEDLLIQYSIENGWKFLAVFTLAFVLNGITLIRTYSRVFWGRRDSDIEVDLDFSPSQAFVRVALFVTGNYLAFVL